MIAILLAVLLVAPLVGWQQPPRDAVRVPASGASSVAGVVVTGERAPQPVRRAIVTITGSVLPVSRSTITDDNGRFAFNDLPAGRFTVSATRKAYLTSEFGATRPGRRGIPINVTEGARADDVRITLPKGAVLTGVISDPSGVPVPLLPVTVFRLASTYTEAGSDVTDDRGEYRVYGLSPGDYVVAAVPRPAGAGDMGVMSEREVDAALSALERRTAGALLTASRPGETARREAAVAEPRAFSFAPFFYPGTAVSAQATKITVVSGEERGGLDFTLGVVPTASVAGMVIDAGGQPARDARLSLLSTGPSVPPFFDMGSLGTQTGPDGSFRFGSVTPGSYRITARRVPGGAPPRPGVFTSPNASTGRGTNAEWAVVELTVNGEDIDGLSLALQPGLRLTGRIVFEGTSEVPSSLAAVRVAIVPFPEPARGGGIAPVAVRANGSFEITNLFPGAYRIALTAPDAVSDTWWPRSGLAGGRDVLDVPLQLTSGTATPDVVFTLSDRRPSMSGMVLGVGRQPDTPAAVIVFSADRAHWLAQSRRIRAVRPATDGQYQVRDLPPGDYLVAVAAEPDPDEIYRPAFLERLAGGAIRVSIAEGEQKVQDVPAGRGRF